MKALRGEELANTLSHGVGIVIGLLVLPFLWNDFTSIIYVFSFLFIFLSSTFYHASLQPERKIFLQKIDHISIYFMIAGSYTPFIFKCLQGAMAWIFFAIMWSIVLFGTIFKLYFTGRFERLSLILYIGMGWMLVFILRPFFAAFDYDTISLVVIGGLLYTSGVYFYAKDSRKYYHFVWHLFVLGGAISHLIAILNIMK